MAYVSLFWACTVTTESPLLNVSFVLEIALISELHWQVQHPTRFSYHMYGKKEVSGDGSSVLLMITCK